MSSRNLASLPMPPSDPRAEVTLVFEGRLEPRDFVALARQRADRLSLTLDILVDNPELFTCRVGGHPALIGMFEMALSLGPATCLVHTVTRMERDVR